MGGNKDATQDTTATTGVSDEKKAGEELEEKKPETKDGETATATDDAEGKTTTEIDEARRKTFPGTRRLNDIDRISENVKKDRDKEMGISSEEDPEKTDQETQETLEGEETTTTGDLKDEEGLVKQPGEGETVTLKVDGKEQEVPLSKVLDAGKRSLQKESAADSRLEEATKLLKEAKERTEQKKLDQPSGDEDPDADQTTTQKAALDAETKEKAVSLAQAIQYGDEDEAAAAIQEVMNLGGDNVTPSNDQVLAMVDKAMKFQNIRDNFSKPAKEGGFGDLTSDPILYAEVNRRINEKLEKGTPNNWDLYEEAGNEVRAWVKTLKGEPSEPTETETLEGQETTIVTDELGKKREKKKKIDTVKSANAKTTTTVAAPEPKTNSEIISEIREARGQKI